MLPFVLTQEVPDLDNLLSLCDGWGYTQQGTEDSVMLIVSVLAAGPLVAAAFLANDELGGLYAGRYGAGPVPSTGGCSDTSELENLLTLASANFYPIATAIRAQAASKLNLDPQDPDDAFLGSIIAIMFLYCYFADLPDQVNIWLVAHGEDPIDFGSAKSSQVSQMTQQLTDLFAENSESFQRQVNFTKLNNFALDTMRTTSYNDSGENGGGGRGGVGGVDIGELNPIRYRGYYWDEETGYYFCRTRYYNSEWRRFINADCYFIAGDKVNDALTASNMYAYCDNNPVMYCDPSGMAVDDIFVFMQNFFSDPTVWMRLVWSMLAAIIKQAFAQENLFYTEEDAVHHFAVNWNRISIDDDREYATFIYETSVNGRTMYSYAKPWRGSSTRSWIPVNWFGIRKKVANAHTHGAKTSIFSDIDLDAARKAGLPEYVVIATGVVWVYYPATDSYKQFKEWKYIPSKYN